MLLPMFIIPAVVCTLVLVDLRHHLPADASRWTEPEYLDGGSEEA